MSRPSTLKDLYGLIKTVDASVGGGEGVEGVYGTLRRGSNKRVMEFLVDGAPARALLVDVGSGIGRFLFHAAYLGVPVLFGIENDVIKQTKAHAATALMAASGVVAPPDSVGIGIPSVPRVSLIHRDVAYLESLCPATHAFMAWQGFPERAKRAVGRLVARSSIERFVVVQHKLGRSQNDPAGIERSMADLEFGDVRLLDRFDVELVGGDRETLVAYCFSREVGPDVRTAVRLDELPAFVPDTSGVSTRRAKRQREEQA